ncbi:DMT family transporter [Bailinhaonella thermotolerans]|uniref:DMT family transporter n=1 Tax=Bailinhaonella thermotolerans TaxID=1070861 RepID=A0A3A4B2L9_9ACTN|nr:DMT family transporter [Bailinhaonella thermotolerans]RJL32425.1 DMT family transporter [Bailinhaonella thermotolerans]
MTAIVLATACAVVYGTADFFGGMATKRAPVYAVVVVSQIGGVLLLVPLLPLLPGTPDWASLGWGALAGLAGGVALIVFYRALASGVMSIVAPTTAAASAALPVVWGLAAGERPSAGGLAGIALALVAVMLVSREPARPGAAPVKKLGPVLAALAAGAGFGLFFALLPAGEAGLWPLIGARAGSIALVAAIALGTRNTLRPGPGTLKVIVVAGVLDMAANVFFLMAKQEGLLSIVSVIASLYPASTLMLARYVLGERLHVIQAAGVVLALGAVGLIALP